MQRMMTSQAVRNSMKMRASRSWNHLQNFNRYYTTIRSKKDLMSEEMADAYHPKQVEAGWYQFWEENGFFKPSNDRSQPSFSVVLPPPNVTGSLHIGHALTAALQDSLCRYKKMNNYRVVWVPGMDHAGISTQVVVEKKLAREQNGKTRHDVGRDAFVELVWKWKEEYGNKITEQMKAVGSMTDWTRHVFTMDSNFSAAVIEAFVRLHEDGLIYRDTKLVNWCSSLKTAISDIEVDYKSLTGKTAIPIPSAGNAKYDFGVLHTFKYPVVDDDGQFIDYIHVSTTRLETMLGDTAVAIHPEDERYIRFHGKYIQHPFIKNRRIPIVCDEILVNMEFGTGAVKVTPAHSFEDNDCGRRNSLEFINILNFDGTLNSNAGEFSGMNRFEARKQIVSKLKDLDLFISEKDHAMEIPVCSRSGDVIEPLLLPQWFVRCENLAKRSLELEESKQMNIYPATYSATWKRWLTNIHDWCISRQLWWGHRIPAYQVIALNNADLLEDPWVVARSIEEAHEKVQSKFNLQRGEYKLEQDADVLDTWFSSGIYPIASFGWPYQTADLEDFYPLSVMETGSDILFFWVARMSMLCTYLNKDIQPFKDIYLHPMIRDAQGRKMSKSLGNVIDPMDVMHGITLKELQAGVLNNTNISRDEANRAAKVMEKDFPKGIQECGADALRFSLIKYTQQGRQINLDVQRVVANRFFCNKIWQATRFAKLHFDRLQYQARYSPDEFAAQLFTGTSSFHNRWIVAKLNVAISTVRTSMESYMFSDAATAIYDFFLYELCDIYLEWIKPLLYSDVDNAERKETLDTLHFCFDNAFRMMHPFMPYISEELWQRLPRYQSAPDSIMLCHYPTTVSTVTEDITNQVFSNMNQIFAVVQELRSVKENLQTAASKTDAFVCIHSEEPNVDISTIQQFYTSCRKDIEVLSKFKSIQIATPGDIHEMKHVKRQKLASGVVNSNCTVYLTLPEDYAEKIQSEIQKLKRKIEQLEQLKERYEKQMSVANYEVNVPEAVRVKTQDKYNQTVTDIGLCSKHMKEMEALLME